MSRPERLSICYAVPGHDLVPSAGPTRNVLDLARRLAAHADVTVAFRRAPHPPADAPFAVAELDPETGAATSPRVNDAALEGMSLREFRRYLRVLRSFVDGPARTFDVILEKSWLLSGLLASRAAAGGTPSAVVENVVRVWSRPVRAPRDLAGLARHGVARTLVGRYLRRTPLVIAETEELKRALVASFRLESSRVRVVGLGVDHDRFRPADREAARRALGWPEDRTILLYVGGLDSLHDLVPAMDALLARPGDDLQLHVVGDGVRRGEYRVRARRAPERIVLHGAVPHEEVPGYVAAADLCLAPYDPAAFPGREVAYSTLKIPEYMAMGRAVASVPSGHIKRLVDPGVSGFLFDNDAEAWRQFLADFPSRDRLAKMGRAAQAEAARHDWERTARGYLGLCEELTDGRDEVEP